MKYLMVDFIDYWASHNTGGECPARHRVVKIPLTPEQVIKLSPLPVGKSGAMLIHEEVHLLSIQEEGAE